MSEARDLPDTPDPSDAPDPAGPPALPEAPDHTEASDPTKENTMTSPQQTPLHDVTDTPSPWPDKPAPRKLTRKTSDKMIAGVCSGIADYINVDVTLVRLGFVALTIITGGVGAIGYVACWIVVPERTI